MAILQKQIHSDFTVVHNAFIRDGRLTMAARGLLLTMLSLPDSWNFSILSDEIYTGTMVQGKQTTPHFKLKELETKPQDEWVRVENTHEAIIDKADFDLVQRLSRLDTRTSPQSDKVYLFCFVFWTMNATQERTSAAKGV